MTLDDSDSSDKSTSVLVLHDESLNPHPFLARLTGTDPTSSAEEGEVPWKIDNKYYTAQVTFEPRPLSLPVTASYPVLLYVFSGQAPNPLPAELTRLVVRDSPPDITLAVRVSELPDNVDRVGELDEEVFDELGMEVVDELGGADEDDERPLDALETVRQTLMTHMWPNMVRKPAPGPAARSAPRPEINICAADSDDESAPQRTSFPVLFANHTGPPPVQRQGSASDFPTPEPHPDHSDDEEDDGQQGGVYAKFDDDGEGGGDFGEFAQPSADEFARLDAWLEDDGDDLAALGRLRALANGAGGFSAGELGDDFGLGPMPTFPASALPADPLAPSFSNLSMSDPSDPSSSRSVPTSSSHPLPTASNGATSSSARREANGGSGFEDDFGPAPSGGEPNIPLDPTPLLLHLQNVRAELADVEDEDERRVRAAREVAQLMGQLGFGEGDLGLDEVEFDDEL